MIDIKEIEERVILVGVSTSDGDDTEASLKELSELVKTAGAVSVGTLIQNREAVHPGTYLGTGKISELKEYLEAEGATGIVCDDELSPAQLRNLESLLDVKVMDRTLVILDIFASRASTREGKIQVELAQLRYRAARLVGLRNSLSRLGGGIGTRGPGEKKLEVDRRLIHQRISVLKAELEDVKRHRETTRKQRERNHMSVAAIVGYTNAGKSTLLNTLTDADVVSEDKLFATLDPTTRELPLPDGETVLLTDTVGFIRKLPHHLVEAFKSTLEEAKYADMILHVVDASNPSMDIQMHTVYETLKSLEVMGKTVITLFNKIDRMEELPILRDFQADETLCISAKAGTGLPELKVLLSRILRERKIYLERLYPYSEAGKIQLIRKYGQLLSEEYKEDGIAVTAYMPAELIGKI
ncbi:GTPase HflX [Qiania dongpingensis]|uniref:GTPase HflX n=1 Tax=Qiania dongpingensis TaxID=2763669 RepID=A0A7G9G406_9FIRM|nr:GTPase HflX [Qiania dongpingensis]QNM05538.1 GTPase HflX [Qiania dongpingensis]